LEPFEEISAAILLELDTDRLNSGVVLEKVVEYMQYWYSYKDQEDVPDMDIPVDICLEVLQAADYLGMDSKYSSLAHIQLACQLTTLSE
jgi:hypothetical protein